MIQYALALLLGQQNPLIQTKQMYKPSPLSPESVARDLDASLANATNLEGMTTFDGVTPIIARAHSAGHQVFVKPTVFHIEYPVLPHKLASKAEKRSESAGTETMIAKDGKFVTFSALRTRKRQPLSNLPKLPADLIDQWSTGFPQYIFLGVGTTVRPFSALVSAARKAGLQVVTETLPVEHGVVKSQDRVTIRRTPEQAKVSGELEYAFTIARPSNHLMMITTRIRPLKEYKTLTTWTAQWRTMKEAPDRKLFQFPFGL